MDFFYYRRVLAFALALAVLLPKSVLPQFTNQTKEARIAFQHVAGGSKKKHIVETSGGGAAFFDYDNDGDLDLYAVNGAAVNTYRQRSGPGNVLYRNQANGTFADVTLLAGVGDRSWGMGCTVGDIDGDGYRDLYVTNYGPNVLYRNQANGTFVDISAGVAGNDYSSSAAFFDYDGDGDLDLYVANYLVYDFDAPPDKICTYEGIEIFCGPQGLPGAADRFYRNNGDDTFTDVTRPSGISWANHYYGLGVLPEDFDNDGDTDLFVANDATPNVLFDNNRDGTFSEIGLKAGIAYNEYGEEEAGMGVSGGDYDADGDLDLYISPNRDAVGAKIRLLAGGRSQWRTANGVSSYLSYNDMRIFFGLGRAEGADEVEITWPDGTRQTVPAAPANKLLVIRQNGPYAFMKMGANPYVE